MPVCVHSFCSTALAAQPTVTHQSRTCPSTGKLGGLQRDQAANCKKALGLELGSFPFQMHGLTYISFPVYKHLQEGLTAPRLYLWCQAIALTPF